ncbi:hypothetical protein X977_4873 [Burkholderia pseudomallei MSHR7504]|nr:hypothetical protein X977_4873 [Burkholderia pseudomallei MSHR7504]
MPRREGRRPCGRRRRSLNGEIDHDRAGLALPVLDAHPRAVVLPDLFEQRKRIVIIDEAHRLAGLKRVDRAENRRVAKALRDTARVERIDRGR